MRTQSFGGSDRRAARLHWWREVLQTPPSTASWDEIFDEMVALRFRLAGGPDAELRDTLAVCRG